MRELGFKDSKEEVGRMFAEAAGSCRLSLLFWPHCMAALAMNNVDKV